MSETLMDLGPEPLFLPLGSSSDSSSKLQFLHPSTLPSVLQLSPETPPNRMLAKLIPFLIMALILGSCLGSNKPSSEFRNQDWKQSPAITLSEFTKR